MTHAVQYVCAHGALVLFTWILVQQAGLPVPGATLRSEHWQVPGELISLLSWRQLPVVA